MYVYISECFHEFMYLYACKSDEREREGISPWRVNCCQEEECCYLSPRSNSIISYKQILTFSVDKL